MRGLTQYHANWQNPTRFSKFRGIRDLQINQPVQLFRFTTGEKEIWFESKKFSLHLLPLATYCSSQYSYQCLSPVTRILCLLELILSHPLNFVSLPTFGNDDHKRSWSSELLVSRLHWGSKRQRGKSLEPQMPSQAIQTHSLPSAIWMKTPHHFGFQSWKQRF